MIISSLLGTALNDPILAITHVSVIPMQNEIVLSDQTVISKGKMIVSMGPSNKIAVPKGATTVSGKGKYLIPGLIDMDVRLESLNDFPLFLANGVTTVFNTQGQPGILNWRNKVSTGELRGPNIVTCGPRIFQAKTTFEAVQSVEAQAKAGYDSIFITTGIKQVSYGSLISSSKKNHLLVFGHVPRSVSLAQVFDAKMPIVHGEEVFKSAFQGVQNVGPLIKKAAVEIARAKLPVIASLVSTTHRVRQAESLSSFLTRTDLRYVAPWHRDSWQLGVNEIQIAYNDKSFQAGLFASLENEKQLIRQLRIAGATVLVGTNANATGMVPGACEVEEIKNLAKLGYSNYAAIRCATAEPAYSLNLSSKIGTLAVGLQADMVLLDGNPLANLDNLEKRSGVVSRGKWLTSAALQNDLNEVPKRYELLLQKGAKALVTSPQSFIAFQSENDPQRLTTQYAIIELVKSGGEAAYATYVNRMVSLEPKNVSFSENGVNAFGYVLLNNKKRPDLAIKVFSVNLRRHPKSANMYDSLAEAYLKDGNKARAIEYYRQALKVDPTFSNSQQMLKTLGVSK